MNEVDELRPEKRFWQDPNEPYSHYYRWVWEYLAYLLLICGIQRESRVLELGCSHGRTSRALLQYMRSPGLYRGLDVDKTQVDEAGRLITSIAPNFQYMHADVYNRHYNPEGSCDASEFVFPFEHGTFDCVYAASLFTHLLPRELENYFKQTYRVLAPGGKALFSFFVLDRYSGPGTSVSPNYEFDHRFENCEGVQVRDPNCPDDIIAYSEKRIRQHAEDANLRVIRIYNGLWSNSPGHALNEQDLVLLECPD